MNERFFSVSVSLFISYRAVCAVVVVVVVALAIALAIAFAMAFDRQARDDDARRPCCELIVCV